MKSFTIKDFIEYNNPCKMCGKNVFLQLFDNNINRLYKCQEVEGTTLTFLLQNKYNGNVYLIFDAKRNRYACTVDLEQYAFSFISTCPNCVSVWSEIIILDKGIVKPLKIHLEQVIITTQSNEIILSTQAEDEESMLTVKALGTSVYKTQLSVPPLLISKWKTKERLMDYIKTYLAFS